MSSRAFVDTFCSTLPGAHWADIADGGLNAWKVGDKMFATIGGQGDGVSVKTPSVEDAQLLIEMERANRAKYFHKSWVRVPFDSVPEDEMADRLRTSYQLIRASLPKKIEAALDPL